MNLGDSGRKPPLPPYGQSAYDNNAVTNTNQYNVNDYLSVQQQQQQPSNEIVVIQTILSQTTNALSQIACIILSADLSEKESFSFNFDVHNPFQTQADYIKESLDAKIWIHCNDFHLQSTLDQCFKSVNKVSPRPQSSIDAAQQFNFESNFNNPTNARIGCSDIYSELQRIALFHLLSPITSNTPYQTQTIASNDFANNNTVQPQQQQVQDSNVVVNDQWTQQNTNDLIVDDIIDSNDMKEQQQQQYTTTATNVNDAMIDQQMQQQDEDVQQQMPMEQQQPIEKMEDVNNTITSANGHYEDEQPQQQTSDILMINDGDNVKEEEEVEQQQQMNDQVQQEDDFSKDVSVKTSNTAPSGSDEQQQQQVNDSQPQQQPRKPNSWAAFAKTAKPQTISPKRRSMQVRSVLSDTPKGSRGGKAILAKSQEAVKRVITEAMKNKSVIWLSYNGHQKPFIPRCVKVIKWENNNNKSTFYAIQHRSKSGNQQRFFLKYVMQVRNEQWRISDRELSELKKRNVNTGWTENGPVRRQRDNDAKNNRPRRRDNDRDSKRRNNNNSSTNSSQISKN